MLKLILFLLFLNGCIEAPPSSIIGENRDMALDVSTPDVGADSGDTNNECIPEASVDFCLRIGKNCGSVSNFDNCNKLRGTNCGSCSEGEACGGGEFTNVCAPGTCQPETDDDFCLASSKNCGTLTGTDQCGDARSAMCGACSQEETCVDNVCECIPPSDAEFCAQRGKNCGEVTGQDSCGQTRAVNCGMCSGDRVCGAGNPGTPNVCGLPNTCEAESDQAFCFNRSKNCGTVEDVDNCNRMRSVNCGTCQLPSTCGGGGSDNVCGCIPTTCPTNACGTFPNGCGGTITCGCNSGVCYNGSCCQPVGACLSGQCGTFPNGCGGTFQCTCPGGGPCYQGQCCVPRTCGFAECGSFDNCGTITECGTCTYGTCVNGSCLCFPEDDPTFCRRFDVNACGDLTALNNCGVQRTVDCGDCLGGNPCVNNVCQNIGGG